MRRRCAPKPPLDRSFSTDARPPLPATMGRRSSLVPRLSTAASSIVFSRPVLAEVITVNGLNGLLVSTAPPLCRGLVVPSLWRARRDRVGGYAGSEASRCRHRCHLRRALFPGPLPPCPFLPASRLSNHAWCRSSVHPSAEVPRLAAQVPPVAAEPARELLVVLPPSGVRPGSIRGLLLPRGRAAPPPCTGAPRGGAGR